MVEFTDNTMQVKAAMTSAVSAFLYEAGGEIQSQTVRNSRTDSGETKGSYEYNVEMGTSGGTVSVGSPLENALWEEFGTGEYALNNDGRKGYWVFVKGSNGKSSKSTKSYSRDEAKQIMAFLRSKGLDAYYTKGKKPNRPLYRAFTSLRDKLTKRLETLLNQRL